MSGATYSAADYLAALQALMPRGRVWPKNPSSVQSQALAGLTPTYERSDAAAVGLLVDAFPATTLQLLPEWEDSLGLPDPCAGQAPTIQQRRAQVVARFTNTVSLVNLLFYSQDFSQAAAWTLGDMTISSSGNPAPDGSPTAQQLTVTGSTAYVQSGHIAVIDPAAYSPGSIYTVSEYFLPGSGTQWFRVAMSDSTSAAYFEAWFDCVNGVLGSSVAAGGAVIVNATITLQSGGFYRCSVTGSLPAHYQHPVNIAAPAATDGSYTGPANGSVFQIWGAQLEIGPAASAYQPTSTVSASNLSSAAASQSAAYFIGFAAALGYAITITNYTPFRIGTQRCGDPLGGPDWAHTWAAESKLNTLVSFRMAISAMGEALETWGNAVLECELQRIAPAHTNLLFQYS